MGEQRKKALAMYGKGVSTMEGRWNQCMDCRVPAFLSLEGVIVEVAPVGIPGRDTDGCANLISIEDDNGNLVEIVVTSDTYVVDYVMLKEGIRATFYYRTDAPMPLIFPPRYRAAVVVPARKDGRFITVGYFAEDLINTEETVQLFLREDTKVLTRNGQQFIGNPGGHNLVACFETATRSIPANVIPLWVVVLCS